MSALAFLSPGPGATARSPMEPGAAAAGATFEERDGWNVAIAFPDQDRSASAVGFADLSHLGKIEVQGDVSAITGHESGARTRTSCRRRLVVPLLEGARGGALRARGHRGAPRPPRRAAADANGLASVVDVTAVWGAMTILGPLARETFARFTAIDLRPQVTPPHAFRPGSVARTGGAILCEAPDRYLMLFGAALGQYVWTVVADAAGNLGGGPVGVDALEPIDA